MKTKMTSKSRRRVEIIDKIRDTMVDENIDYDTNDDLSLKNLLYHNIRHKLEDILNEYYMMSEEKSITEAYKTLILDGDVHNTLNNIHLFGCAHRADMVVELPDFSIAIEFKFGDFGSSICDLLAQSMVYSQCYDFSISLFIDTSPDKCIKKSIQLDSEQWLIDSLWNNYNARIDVI